MAGVYRLSFMDIRGSIRNIPHRPLCNCGFPALFIPGTRKRDCQEVLLAINIGRNHCGGLGHMPSKSVLIPFAPHKGGDTNAPG